MLIEEFGVKPVGSVQAAREALAEAPESWREIQIATAVRDAPSVAVALLEGRGYDVKPPKRVPENERDRLRAF